MHLTAVEYEIVTFLAFGDWGSDVRGDVCMDKEPFCTQALRVR